MRMALILYAVGRDEVYVIGAFPDRCAPGKVHVWPCVPVAEDALCYCGVRHYHQAAA